MFHEVKSTRLLAAIQHDFAEAARKEGFGTLATHDLHAKLNEKGVPFAPHCLVFEICDPRQARDVLEADPRMASLLPCRIAAHDLGGATTLSMVLPTAMLAPDASPALKTAAAEVETRMKKLVDALK
ncbi:MAG: DUF302 domain-containing protein [Planctomycetota bacterium]